MRNFAVALLSIMAACVGRPAFAQCSATFNFTADGSQAQIDNRTNGCIDFQLTYNASGASALSLLVESAPDNNGTPGAWVSFAGTVNTGINPNVDTDQEYTLMTGYYPWVRVTLSGLMGGSARVRGTLKGLVAAASPGGGVVPQPLEVQGCGPAGNTPECMPVLIAGIDNLARVVLPLHNQVGAATNSLDTGTTDETQYETDFTCNLQAAIALTASGLTQIIALTSQSDIRVCHVSMSGDAAVNVKFSTGTGTNCGTGTADLTGLYYGINSLALDFSNHAALRVPISQALCVSLSTAANWGGIVVYSKFEH